eukprot:g13968.t1
MPVRRAATVRRAHLESGAEVSGPREGNACNGRGHEVEAASVVRKANCGGLIWAFAKHLCAEVIKILAPDLKMKCETVKRPSAKCASCQSGRCVVRGVMNWMSGLASWSTYRRNSIQRSAP